MVDSMLPVQGARMPSLVGRLRSHMLYGLDQKKKKKVGALKSDRSGLESWFICLLAM